MAVKIKIRKQMENFFEMKIVKNRENGQKKKKNLRGWKIAANASRIFLNFNMRKSLMYFKQKIVFINHLFCVFFFAEIA